EVTRSSPNARGSAIDRRDLRVMDATLYYAIERIEGLLVSLRKDVTAIELDVTTRLDQLKHELGRMRAEQQRLAAELGGHPYDVRGFRAERSASGSGP